MRKASLGVLVVVLLALGALTAGADETVPPSPLDGVLGQTRDRTITYVGVVRDKANLATSGLGDAGWWFPHVDGDQPRTGQPTWFRAADVLPAWVEAFNHTTEPTQPGCDDPSVGGRPCTPTYLFRTFSQDGPARSAGGQGGWSRVRLPDGDCVLSGAIVDPQTFLAGEPNNNNTVNRLQLYGDVPATFYVSVLVDNTARAHDATRVELRGNAASLDVPEEVADSQVEPAFDTPMPLSFNGIPDAYIFRVRNFVAGDYLKLRLRGTTSSAASFGGLLFDRDLDDKHASIRPIGSCRLG